MALVAAVAWHLIRLPLIGYVQDDLTAGGRFDFGRNASIPYLAATLRHSWNVLRLIANVRHVAATLPVTRA